MDLQLTPPAPRWAYESETLALTAADIHRRRVQGNAAHVAAGRLTQAASDHAIAAIAAIAEDWRYAVEGGERPVSAINHPARVATLESALIRPRAMVEKARAAITPATARHAARKDFVQLAEEGWFADNEAVIRYAEARDYLELVETLLWWERKHFGPASLRALNDHIRADIQQPAARAA